MRSKEIEQYKLGLALNEEQREVLIGVLLGDACLESRNGCRTYRLKIEQSIKHEAYLLHLYRIFKNWVLSGPKERSVSLSGRINKNMRFQTVSHGAFRFYGQQFYRNGKKCVPKGIGRLLTPKAVAYWYMDDGSIKSKESKGVIFNAHSFTRFEIQELCTVLQKKFLLKAKPRLQKDGYQIYVSGESYETFTEIVRPHLIPEMYYKIPSARRTQLPKE